jgi:hypothetical protein
VEIIEWKDGQMIRVTRDEALEIISSLSLQLKTRDVNSERSEFTDQNGKYFSISVHDKECNPHCPIGKAVLEDARKKATEEFNNFNCPLEEPV